MVTSLIGQNSFMLNAQLHKLKADFLREYGEFGLETIDVAEWDVGRIIDTLSAMPFLSPKRMVIINGLAANKLAADAVDILLKAIPDSTDVLIVEPKIDKRSVLYKTLKKQTSLHEYTDLDPRDVPKWLVAEAKVRGGSLSLGDAAYLVARVGGGQQLLSSELDKLLLYDTNIARTSIDMLTEQAPLSSIFELIEAAFNGNIKKALALYDDQRAQNVEPLAIEALFVWQLHVLLLVKAAGTKNPDVVAAESGISPYVAKKSAALVTSRSFADLKGYVSKLASLEYDIKTTAVDSDDVLKNYILLLGQ